jgi:hypothetical protein
VPTSVRTICAGRESFGVNLCTGTVAADRVFVSISVEVARVVSVSLLVVALSVSMEFVMGYLRKFTSPKPVELEVLEV